MINDIFIYQIGTADTNFHVFNQAGLSIDFVNSLKKNIDTIPQADGVSNARGLKSDFKDAMKIKVDYLLYEQGSNNNLEAWNNNDPKVMEQIMRSGAIPVFFYRELVDKTLEFYYNIGTPTILPGKSKKDVEIDGEEAKGYGLEILFTFPYLFRINNNDLTWLDISAFQASSKRWGTGLYFGGTPAIYWGEYFGSYKTLDLSSFLGTGAIAQNNDKRDRFINDRRKAVPLLLTDRYFTRTPTPTAWDINTVGSDSWTLTDNNPLFTNLTNLKVDGNCDQTVYMIKFPILQPSEWISIQNITTRSEFRLTWLNGIAYTNPLIFNSITPSKLFDSVTGDEIPNTAYAISPLNPNWDLLYFNELSSNNLIQTLSPDQLTLQKNTASSLTITINNITLFN